VSFSEPVIARPPYSALLDWADGVLTVSLNLGNYGFLFEDPLYVAAYLSSIATAGAATLVCLVIAYPMALLIARSRYRVLLLMLVILPFWTSFLLRMYALIGLMAPTGFINAALGLIGIPPLAMLQTDFAVYMGIVTGYLPLMILPLYSVMKTIPPSYERAAKSLGASNWTAFWRVYFPQTVPGIGAGAILVFILAIGYYITPELVGGTSGTFISNRIAYHISSSLNWGLAAALGTILLVLVLALYWVYDQIVGIDNVKLG
ncbi:MAG: ABC transporter permease, partial [Pseudomonadota bacterium]